MHFDRRYGVRRIDEEAKDKYITKLILTNKFYENT